MNQFLKIDSTAVSVYTNKLELLSKSALPNAVRNTLNKAAFDVKGTTMPISVRKHFVIRKENFFKANSKVVMAKGYDINTMKSEIGFVRTNLKFNNKAIDELRQQEYSGTIGKRSFLPINRFARSGGSKSGQILPSNRLKSILQQKKIFYPSNSTKGRTKKEKFVIAAILAGRRGLVMGNSNKEDLFRITSITRVKGDTVITKVPIYSHRSGRNINIRAIGFMREASLKSAAKIDKFYIAEAERQINRAFK